MEDLKTKYALVNGELLEARPELKGKGATCRFSGLPMIAKTGRKRRWHWAYKGDYPGDISRHESEWHFAWKEKFPEPWREVDHPVENGKKFRADVKTEEGWAIEFQYSPIHPDERQSRDNFYPKIVWVVYGAKLDRDIEQFKNALKEGKQVHGSHPDYPIWRTSLDKCELLQEWAGSKAPIFFDFGEEDVLWQVHYVNPNGSVYATPFSRIVFIMIHLAQKPFSFEHLVNTFSKFVENKESPPPPPKSPTPKRRPLYPVRGGRRL